MSMANTRAATLIGMFIDVRHFLRRKRIANGEFEIVHVLSPGQRADCRTNLVH